MKNFNSRKIIAVNNKVAKQKKSPQHKNNPSNYIDPINHKSEKQKLSNLLFKKETANLLNSQNKPNIQNKNNQKITQKRIQLKKSLNHIKAVLPEKILSYSIEDNFNINKLSNMKNEKSFCYNNDNYTKSSAYNLNYFKNNIPKNFNLNEPQSNDSSAIFKLSNISQGKKNENQIVFKNGKNSPKQIKNNNFQGNSKFLLKKQETKQNKNLNNKDEPKTNKQKIISPKSNNTKKSSSNKGICKNNNFNAYKKKIITEEKTKNKLSKKPTKFVAQKRKDNYGIQEKNSDNSKNKTKASNTTNYENNKKISEYNITASNYENSQNKISDMNNSSNKNNSENFKIPFLVSGLNKINFSEQNKKELEYLLKGNTSQTKKSLFSEHMNFLLNHKEQKFHDNKNNNINKEDYINEKLCENFLESIDKLPQQDFESKFINYNLGMTTGTSLTKESLILSFTKNNLIKNAEKVKNGKLNKIKNYENNNENNIENKEDSSLSDKDKFLNNINEFDGEENIKKINNIVFNKHA